MKDQTKDITKLEIAAGFAHLDSEEAQAKLANAQLKATGLEVAAKFKEDGSLDEIALAAKARVAKALAAVSKAESKKAASSLALDKAYAEIEKQEALEKKYNIEKLEVAESFEQPRKVDAKLLSDFKNKSAKERAIFKTYVAAAVSAEINKIISEIITTKKLVTEKTTEEAFNTIVEKEKEKLDIPAIEKKVMKSAKIEYAKHKGNSLPKKAKMPKPLKLEDFAPISIPVIKLNVEQHVSYDKKQQLKRALALKMYEKTSIVNRKTLNKR